MPWRWRKMTQRCDIYVYARLPPLLFGADPCIICMLTFILLSSISLIGRPRDIFIADDSFSKCWSSKELCRLSLCIISQTFIIQPSFICPITRKLTTWSIASPDVMTSVAPLFLCISVTTCRVEHISSHKIWQHIMLFVLAKPSLWLRTVFYLLPQCCIWNLI